MPQILLGIALFLLSVAALAAGTLLAGRRINGSCGGCAACARPCKRKKENP